MFRRKLRPVFLAAAATVFVAGCYPPETVEYVDLNRYLGSWYELASYPAIFQRGCTGTMATYGRSESRPGEITVVNDCFRNGEWDTIEGRATIADSATNAKLSVYFGPFPGDYWIIDLDPAPGGEPYRWAVVSTRLKNFLWILSREPSLDDATLDGILDRLEAQGFDLDRLQWTAPAPTPMPM